MAPERTVLVTNNATGAQESLPVSAAVSGVRDGTYRYTTESNVRTAVAPGVDLESSPEAGAARMAAGEEPVSAAESANRAAENRREALADVPLEAAHAFLMGIADSASMGLAPRGSDWDEFVRERHAIAHGVGELVPLLVGDEASAPGVILSAGKAAGKSAARALVGEVRSAGTRVVSRALEEATAGAALMGAQSFGQQLNAVVSRGADFDAAAVVHDAGFGAVMGGAFGAAGGALERLPAANRAEVRASGGLMDPASPESLRVKNAVEEIFAAGDGAVVDYGRRVGAGRVIARDFPDLLPPGALDRGEAALKRAVGSAERLRAHNLDVALGGRDLKAAEKLISDLEDHHEALSEAERALEPTSDELVQRAYQRARANPVVPRPYEPTAAPAFPADRGVDLEAMHGVDRIMEHGAPAAEIPGKGFRPAIVDPKAAYERIWGRPFETTEDVLMNGPLPAEEGAANLGGEVTPTSENVTGVGKRRGNIQAPVAGEISTGTRSGQPFAPAEGLAPAGPPGPGVLSPAPEPLTGGRDILPKAPEGNRLNEAYSQEVLHLLPNGRFAPATRPESAELFDQFKDRVLEDSRIGRARSAASVEKFRMERSAPEAVSSSGAPAPEHPPAVAEGLDLLERYKKSSAGAPAEPAPGPKVTGGKHGPPEPPARPGDTMKRLADEWWKSGVLRRSPLDDMATRLRGLSEDIRNATGGRLDAAASTDFAAKSGMKPARTSLGEQLQQIVVARRIGDALADESRGAATPLRAAERSRILSWLGRRTAGRLGSSVVGGVIGGTLGGPAGFLLGVVVADRVMGVSGKVAGSVGRTMNRVRDAGARLLRPSVGPRAAVALRAGRPIYSEDGHEPDPVLRSQQVVQLAANPDVLVERVKRSLGDAALLHPELADALAKNAVSKITHLSLRAPMLMWNALGVPRAAEESQLRNFEAYEAATFDLPGLLTAAERGVLTSVQADALAEQHPEVRSALAESVMNDLDALRSATRDRLTAVQRATGLDLTGSDPLVVARRQLSWGPPKPMSPQLKPGALTPPAPTPASGSARAPGN